MPSETPTFHHFPTLPKEIRLLIWETAITPQLIPITTTITPFIPSHAPSFLYLLGGDPPYTHFTLDDNVPSTPEQPRPNEPYYTALSLPSQSHYPALLSACLESRTVALNNGYIPWIIQNQHLKTKHLMWNPNIDVIYFTSQESSRSYFSNEIPLFAEQYPKETGLVQRLAVVSSWMRPQSMVGAWGYGYGRFEASMDPKTLVPFKDLRDLVVVVDDEGEKGSIRRRLAGWEAGTGEKGGMGDVMGVFDGVREMVDGLGREEREWVDGYGKRDSRVVLDEEGILGGYNLGLELMRSQTDDF